jgi:hypothetical protein
MTNRQLPFPKVSDELPILLRAFVESAQKVPRNFRLASGQNPQAASDWSIVIDNETTTDPGQSLRVGFCRVYHRDEFRRHVLFHADDLSGNDLKIVNQFARPHLEIMSREEFVDTIFYKYAYHLRAMIIGFNLPFDLSRLAVSHASARGSMRGGFSLKLSLQHYQPPVQIKHLSKYVSILRFAAFESLANRSQRKRGRAVPYKRGYFLELRALAVALLSRSFTLAGLAEFLGVEHQKLETDNHGKPLTRQYLQYAERDVLTTWQCYREMVRRYEALELRNTPVHRIFSEASIGKAYFAEMGIEPWFNVQKDIPRRLLAQIMSAYFGGRSEIRIRRELRQVMLCDFLSMYPTVCTLTGLWQYVIGREMICRDGTREVSQILESWTLKDLQVKKNWRKLVALVQVRLNADIFPVRAQYNDGADGTIGANYITSKTGLWFTLADCLASQLLTGKPVEVLQAIVFKPGPPQRDLRSVAISGNPDYRVDPYKDDFYRRMIEMRHVVKARRDKSKGTDHDKLDVEQNALKIATNATSYGIFAEINVNDRAKLGASRIHAANSAGWVMDHIKDEQPGKYFHPLLAATITGAARLMLALAERLILDEGLEWAFCDTDSMAIAKPEKMTESEFYKRVDRIVGRFGQLNPYNFDGSILKIEDVNSSLENPKKRRPLFVWAVSAKRYALFNIENGEPVIRKASAHGLGQFQAPYDKKTPARGIPAPRAELGKIGVEHWQHDLWWLIAKAAIDGHPDNVKFNHHPSLTKPAASRYAATTPKSLRWFDKYNDGLSYALKLKPFGFVSAFSARVLIDQPLSRPRGNRSKANVIPKPVAPFDKNPVIAAQNAFDRNTRESIPVEFLKTYQRALIQYHLHPEDKFLNGDFLDRGTTLRRHIRVIDIEYIGKESNKWEDQYDFGLDADEEIRYGSKPLATASLFEAIQKIVENRGLRLTALDLNISRTTLSKLLKQEFADCSPVDLHGYSRIVADINSEQKQMLQKYSKLLELAKLEVQKTGITELARQIDFDQSNLQKIFSGERKLNLNLVNTLTEYFDSLFSDLRAKSN